MDYVKDFDGWIEKKKYEKIFCPRRNGVVANANLEVLYD